MIVNIDGKDVELTEYDDIILKLRSLVQSNLLTLKEIEEYIIKSIDKDR